MSAHAFTFDVWKNIVIEWLRAWGWEDRRIFAAFEHAGNAEHEWDNHKHPKTYAEWIDRTAPLDLLGDE